MCARLRRLGLGREHTGRDGVFALARRGRAWYAVDRDAAPTLELHSVSANSRDPLDEQVARAELAARLPDELLQPRRWREQHEVSRLDGKPHEAGDLL